MEKKKNQLRNCHIGKVTYSTNTCVLNFLIMKDTKLKGMWQTGKKEFTTYVMDRGV